jgi:hypothetical protein
MLAIVVRKLCDVTMKQCPLSMSATATVMEACNPMPELD